jgi:hypothetical protein
MGKSPFLPYLFRPFPVISDPAARLTHPPASRWLKASWAAKIASSISVRLLGNPGYVGFIDIHRFSTGYII